MIVRPCAGADHRRVPDAAGQLPAHPAGGRCGGQVALAVECDRADRAVLVGPVVTLALALGDEPLGVLEVEPGVDGEALGALADEERVRRLLHDRAGQADGMADAGHARAGAGLADHAVHDRGVHLDAPVGGQHGSTPGVEQRALLERLTAASAASSAGAPAVSSS